MPRHAHDGSSSRQACSVADFDGRRLRGKENGRAVKAAAGGGEDGGECGDAVRGSVGRSAMAPSRWHRKRSAVHASAWCLEKCGATRAPNGGVQMEVAPPCGACRDVRACCRAVEWWRRAKGGPQRHPASTSEL